MLTGTVYVLKNGRGKIVEDMRVWHTHHRYQCRPGRGGGLHLQLSHRLRLRAKTRASANKVFLAPVVICPNRKNIYIRDYQMSLPHATPTNPLYVFIISHDCLNLTGPVLALPLVCMVYVDVLPTPHDMACSAQPLNSAKQGCSFSKIALRWQWQTISAGFGQVNCHWSTALAYYIGCHGTWRRK